MQRKVLLTFMFVLSIRPGKGVTSSAIPNLLYHCYSNDTYLIPRQPLTIESLIEIIRKLENLNENNVNARILATSMLHTVILDGIRQTQEAQDESMIPFRASGEEFYKYKLLVDYLTSGESSLFPSESLTPDEICFLHTILSSTVDPRRRGDESTTCVHQSNLPGEIEAMEERNPISKCPIKNGIISTKWGSVSAGHLIKAIASALQKSRVTLERLEEAINHVTTTNVNVPKRNEVNNIWVATIAGDLATVVLKQTSHSPEIGTEGFWNDTVLPRVYYLKSTNWDMTEADILGGIDGLAIARYLEDHSITGIRVSQIIAMFYSDRGIMNDPEYKVTNRSLILNKLLKEVRLEDQVENAAKLLQEIGTYGSLLHSQGIKDFTATASEKFRVIADNITRIYDNVESIHGGGMKSSAEIIMIFDGSYDIYNALQIIHGVSEAIQVSQRGSKVGIINGQSGNWMANVTSELFQLFNELESAREWPSTLSLGRSLESIIYYYHNITEKECLSKNVKPMARSILIMSKDAQLTDNDFKSSTRAFDSIKKANPETSFVLVTPSNKTSLMELTQKFSDNDYVIIHSGNTNSLIQDMAKVFSNLSGNIINFFCKKPQVYLEDYITPNEETKYHVRKEYVQATPITTKFRNANQGRLSVCAGSSTKGEICRNITVNDEISFNSEELCVEEVVCSLEFRVSVEETDYNCVENGCRYADQIRLDIIWERSSGYVPAISHIPCLMLIGIFVIL